MARVSDMTSHDEVTKDDKVYGLAVNDPTQSTCVKTLCWILRQQGLMDKDETANICVDMFILCSETMTVLMIGAIQLPAESNRIGVTIGRKPWITI